MCRAARLFQVLLLVVAALIPSRRAWASACCGSSYGIGTRLAPAEIAAGSVLVRSSVATGSWSPEGRFRPPGALHHELRIDVAGQLRVNQNIQLGAAAPMLSTVRFGPRQSGHGAGIGDASVSGRYDLIPVGGMGRLPGVGLTLGATVPTGRAPDASSAPLGSDVTGAGLWELRPGVMIERSWLSGWFVVAAGSVALRAPTTDARGHWLQHQPRIQLTLAGGPTFRRVLAFALGVTHEREAALLVEKVPVPRGDRARTSLFGIVAWEATEHWTVVATSQADVPLHALGRNEPTQFSVGLGLRRVWLDYD